MIYEYKTILLSGRPDAMLSAHSEKGWEFITATNGGYDREGNYLKDATTIWFRRERRTRAKAA